MAHSLRLLRGACPVPRLPLRCPCGVPRCVEKRMPSPSPRLPHPKSSRIPQPERPSAGNEFHVPKPCGRPCSPPKNYTHGNTDTLYILYRNPRKSQGLRRQFRRIIGKFYTSHKSGSLLSTLPPTISKNLVNFWTTCRICALFLRRIYIFPSTENNIFISIYEPYIFRGVFRLQGSELLFVFFREGRAFFRDFAPVILFFLYCFVYIIRK